MKQILGASRRYIDRKKVIKERIRQDNQRRREVIYSAIAHKMTRYLMIILVRAPYTTEPEKSFTSMTPYEEQSTDDTEYDPDTW